MIKWVMMQLLRRIVPLDAELEGYDFGRIVMSGPRTEGTALYGFYAVKMEKGTPEPAAEKYRINAMVNARIVTRKGVLNIRLVPLCEKFADDYTRAGVDYEVFATWKCSDSDLLAIAEVLGHLITAATIAKLKLDKEEGGSQKS